MDPQYALAQAKEEIAGLTYRVSETPRGPQEVIATQTAHCLEAAMLAAYRLESMFGADILVLDGRESSPGHAVYLYQVDGRYGTIGKSRYSFLENREPTLGAWYPLDVAETYQKAAEDAGIEPFSTWQVMDLSAVLGTDTQQWHSSEIEFSQVEWFCSQIPGTKFD